MPATEAPDAALSAPDMQAVRAERTTVLHTHCLMLASAWPSSISGMMQVPQHAAGQLKKALCCRVQVNKFNTSTLQTLPGARLGFRPPSTDSSVVLPLPDGPISASTSPGWQAPVTPNRICAASCTSAFL